MEEIRKHLNRFALQSEEEWQYFSSRLKPQNYPKGSVILKKGKVEEYLSYVESGILRLYIPEIENDVTFGFIFFGQFVSAYDSFLTRMPPENYKHRSITAEYGRQVNGL